MAKKMLHTKAEVLKEGIKADEGILEAVVGSTGVLDRMGDSISQDGWKLTNFKKNPVILWGHNRKEERPPIGKALRVWIEDKNEKKAKLMFKVKFDLQDNFAKEIFRKIRDGFLNTVSVGFVPIEWEDMEEKDFFGSRKYLKQDLLELSFVPVPANPEALVALKEMEDSRFSPVKLEDLYPAKKDNVEEEEEKEVEKVEKETKKVKKVKKIKEEIKEVKKVKKVKKVEVETEKKEEKPVVETKTPKVTKKKIKPLKDEEKDEEKEEVKGVLPFKELETLPESADWDGPGEIAKAEVSDLKLICTWFNSEKPDAKSSYKLPHHKADGHKVVWRGVAAAMAALLGARGGTSIPDSDRKGVYNHLKKHYKQFDKDIPSFKAVENQILKGFGEEIHALILDREDKYIIRLIKKVLKEQKEVKKIKTKEIKITRGYTPKQIRGALELLDMALSGYKVDSSNGGDKKG